MFVFIDTINTLYKNTFICYVMPEKVHFVFNSDLFVPKGFCEGFFCFSVKVSTVLSRVTYSIDAYHECNK